MDDTQLETVRKRMGDNVKVIVMCSLFIRADH
jgi:hypothetical protein